jgi:hypothetical protein
MSTSMTTHTEPPPLGMFELDALDTVVYARLEAVGRDGGAVATDLMGRGFFEGAAPFTNADELRRRIHYFRSNGAPADGFDFDFQYEHGELPVRVLLARVSDFADNRVTKSILVHIRQRR